MKSSLLSPSAIASPALPHRPESPAGDTVRLRRGQTWSSSPGRGGIRLRVLQGVAWITQTGDRLDYVRRAGESFVTAAAGRIVVESLSPRVRLATEAGAV